jgi:Ca-activated chloride channel homolog
MGWARFISLVVFALSVTSSFQGDQMKGQLVPQTTPQPPIQVHVDLVNLHVTVLDSKGKNVSGLQKSDFKVYEDKVAQDISLFNTESETPVTVGILLDTSSSMGREKLEKAIEAVREMARTLSPQDEIFIMEFTEQPSLLVDFTPAGIDLKRAFSGLVAKGGTNVGAAVEEGIFKMNDASNKKQALVVISDGLDIAGAGVIDKIRSHETLVYGIGLKGISGLREVAAYLQALNVHGSSLNVYAEESGAKAIFVKSLEEISGACRAIVDDLKGQYQVAYYPSNAARDGKYRRIKVEISHPGNEAQCRRGYYAPRR